MRIRSFYPVASCIASALAALFTADVRAAGFQLQNQTGAGNGHAFAGAAAVAEDAGTVFFNPAGMTLLQDKHSLSVAGTILNRAVNFSGGSTAGLLPPPSVSNGRDGGGTTLIPALYWVYAPDLSLRIGLGISPTFGNKTNYGFDFIGRYAGHYADLRQININPAVAFRVSERWSIAAGINYAQNDTEFRQGSPLPLPTAANDVTVKGKDNAFGYNAGLLFRLQPQTRLALTYRSEMKFRLDGQLDSNLTPTVDARVYARLTTPSQASFAIAHQLNDRLELLGDLTWTGWSSVDTLDVIDKGSGALLNSLSYRFRDSWRIGLGASYRLSDAWKLRIGTAWDQTPVRSMADRTMTLPDANRVWLAFGARYAIDPANSLDIGYAHVFFADAPIDRAVKDLTGVTVQQVSGKVDTRADLLSLQWNHSFR